MKVKELIEKLSNYPEDLEVVYWDGCTDTICSFKVIYLQNVEKTKSQAHFKSEYALVTNGSIEVVELRTN